MPVTPLVGEPAQTCRQVPQRQYRVVGQFDERARERIAAACADVERGAAGLRGVVDLLYGRGQIGNSIIRP
jgi:hypothetical protein